MVSLTVNSIITKEFTVNTILYKWENITFQYNKVNNSLNLEVNMIAQHLYQPAQYKYN
nr:hypothetical protein [Wolbachia endosymbiont of Onchocerca gibsoni]